MYFTVGSFDFFLNNFLSHEILLKIKKEKNNWNEIQARELRSILIELFAWRSRLHQMRNVKKRKNSNGNKWNGVISDARIWSTLHTANQWRVI